METAQSQLSYREVMQIPSFRRLWLAQTVSLFGDFLALFAVLSYASFKLNASPALVTFSGVAFLLPLALFGPIAGVFVDRWDLKRTMVISDLLRAGLMLALVFVPNLFGIYVILLSLSLISTFFSPAQSVMLRTAVPPPALLPANALMQQAMQVIRIVGPAVAGAMVAWFGVKVCYYINSGSFLFSAVMVASVTAKREVSERVTPRGTTINTILSELLRGMRFIFTHGTISFIVLSIMAGMFALSCFGPLVAIYVRDTLKANEFVFGVINSMTGVGMILCTVLIGKFAQPKAEAPFVIQGLFCLGLSVVLMAAFGNIVMAAVGMFLLGVGAALTMLPSQTLIQAETPVDMMGRVSSSVSSLLSFAQVFGLIFSGSLAQQFGIVKLFYLSAAMLAAIAIFGFFRLQNKSPYSANPTG